VKGKGIRVVLPEIVYDGTTGDATVVAYDPGGVTGWAVFSVHPVSLIRPEYKVLENVTHFTCGQFIGTEFAQATAMIELAREWPGAALVVEDFLLRKFDASRNLLSPVRLTAAFRYTLLSVDKRAAHMQQPSLAMTTMTDERLKATGYFERTVGVPHARDAVRHCLTFLKRLKMQPELLRSTFPALQV
jgi:hypothetical protein